MRHVKWLPKDAAGLSSGEGGGEVPDEHGEDGWGEDSLEPARNTHAYVDPHGSDTPSLLSFLPAGFSPQGIMLVCAIL